MRLWEYTAGHTGVDQPSDSLHTKHTYMQKDAWRWTFAKEEQYSQNTQIPISRYLLIVASWPISTTCRCSVRTCVRMNELASCVRPRWSRDAVSGFTTAGLEDSWYVYGVLHVYALSSQHHDATHTHEIILDVLNVHCTRFVVRL